MTSSDTGSFRGEVITGNTGENESDTLGEFITFSFLIQKTQLNQF